MSYIPLTFKIKGKIHPRSQFSAQEDEKLTNLVKLYGDDNWDDISNLMKNRNVRQCKERWFNYLAPNVKNCPWTPEEDALLEKLYSEYGSKWVKISQMIDGRTDTNVKNRYCLLQRHKKRKEKNNVKNKTDKKLQVGKNLENLVKNNFDKINQPQNDDFFSQIFDDIVDPSYGLPDEWDLLNLYQ